MMKKTIILIPLILLFAPLVSAAECSWNPLTWWDCLTDLFADNTPYELCENETTTYTINKTTRVYKGIKGECNPLNISDCNKQYPNGTKYNEYPSSIGIIEEVTYNETICIPNCAVKVGYEILAYEGFCGMVIDEIPVFHDCDGDGTCRYSRTRCRTDNSQVCFEPTENKFYTSGHYKKNLIKKEITKSKMNKIKKNED